MSSRGGTEGPTFQIVGSCNVFWDLQTFTGNSFVISVQSLSHSLNLLLPKFLSSGILLRSMPLPCSRRGFLQRPFSVNRTSPGSLLWRWMHRTPEWERSCPSRRMASSTHVPSTLATSLPQNVIMTSETGNYWPSSSPWRSGGTGWREQRSHSSCGRIIRTWSTFVRPDASTLGRPGGLCFLHALISLSPTGRGHGI